MAYALAFLALAALALLGLRAYNKPVCDRELNGWPCRGDRCECKKVNYE